MKIKNVEISAFRIYDDPKNATFDFADSHGDTANFVSLYAPNGFGKTSFYDAVEWGITKSINRFYIRNKELEKLANFQAQQNELPLIRNSKSNRDTYVKVVDNNGTLIKEEFWKHGNQIHDINFKTPIIHDFQQVILSQEWISAFLTESDGETRYKKFMEKPDLASMNNYYNNLKYQLKVLKDEKNSLIGRIQEYEKEIIHSNQEDLLITINTQIQLLISKFQQKSLFQIQLSTTKEEVKNLKDIIANNQISNNKELTLRDTLNNISIAKSGNEYLVGINIFFEYKSILDDILKNIATIESHLKSFQELEKYANELNGLKKNISLIVEQRDKCDDIIQLFEEYKTIDDLIKNKEVETLRLKTESSPLHSQLETNRRSEIEIKSKLDSVIQQLDLITNKIIQFPEVKDSINETNKKITSLLTSLEKERSNQSNLEKELGSVNDSINNIRNTIKKISEDNYSLSSVKDNPKLIHLIKQLEEKKPVLQAEKLKLKELDKQIEHQQELNSTIQDFIKSGLAIINKRHSSNCPLCEQIYSSHTELAEKISNNTALSSLLQQLFLDQNVLVKNISSIESELKKGKAALLEFYNLEISKSEENKKIYQEELDKRKKEIVSQEDELKKVQTTLTGLTIQFEGMNINEYEEHLQKRKTALDDSKNLLLDQLEKKQIEIIKIKELADSIQAKIVLITKEIQELNKNEKYVKVKDWFRSNISSEVVDKTKLTSSKNELVAQLHELLKKQKALEESIDAKNKHLSSYTKESLGIQRAELQQKRIEAQQKIEGYNNFIKENFNIDSKELDKKELSKLIKEKELYYKSELDKNTRLIDEYSKLEKYSENIAEFLQSENAKQQLIQLNNQLSTLTSKVEPILNDEKGKVKSHLQEKIQKFFYEKLINDLYKKIDPHPEFKEVKFQADFESDSPRLDVFVKNIGEEKLLIPNLYFSTAQINILSLSIFLATALNSTKYDCIFIDDPVQSMDSINILSTIDLLRSIVVNHNKQIILSTHDENFHNLLKKKMPPDLFKSKFLELESFGKVKTV